MSVDADRRIIFLLHSLDEILKPETIDQLYNDTGKPCNGLKLYNDIGNDSILYYTLVTNFEYPHLTTPSNRPS